MKPQATPRVRRCALHLQPIFTRWLVPLRSGTFWERLPTPPGPSNSQRGAIQALPLVMSNARPVVRPRESSRYYVAFPRRQAVAEGSENCFVPSIRHFGV
ncbi:hypothetical protein AB4144_43770 [Rhizobiaceae sp. 2RAB30]